MEPPFKKQQSAPQSEGMHLRTRRGSRHVASVNVSAAPTPTSTDSRPGSFRSDSSSSSVSQKRKLDSIEDLPGFLNEIPSRSSIEGSPQTDFREGSTPAFVPKSSAKTEGRKKRKTGYAEKLITAVTRMASKRPPGRQRVPKKNPRIEAYYIRMHELKSAFRDVARAVLPALHELESRTENNIKTKPGYLEGSEEYKNVTKALNTHLENRQILEKVLLNQNLEQVKRENESAKQLVKDTYSVSNFIAGRRIITKANLL